LCVMNAAISILDQGRPGDFLTQGPNSRLTGH